MSLLLCDEGRTGGQGNDVETQAGVGSIIRKTGSEESGTLVSTNSFEQQQEPARRRSSKIQKTLPSVWFRLPNTCFGIPMGLGGQAVLWSVLAEDTSFAPRLPVDTLHVSFWVTCLFSFLVFLGCYLIKAVFHFTLVRDEYEDATRIHFFNMPHLIVLVLMISFPFGDSASSEELQSVSRSIWMIGFAVQLLWTHHIYEIWLFSQTHNLSCARPHWLLSTVGWFFLAILGSPQQAAIKDLWGTDVPLFCFGFGLMLYFVRGLQWSKLSLLLFCLQLKRAPFSFRWSP